MRTVETERSHNGSCISAGTGTMNYVIYIAVREVSYVIYASNLRSIRAPDKSVYQKTIFFISYPKHMLWVLKRTVSLRRFS